MSRRGAVVAGCPAWDLGKGALLLAILEVYCDEETEERENKHKQLVITHTPPPFFCNRIRRQPSAAFVCPRQRYTISYLFTQSAIFRLMHRKVAFLYGAEADADFFPRRAS